MSRDIRIHPTDRLPGEVEELLLRQSGDVGVVIRSDGSLDVYGHVPILDQRPDPGPSPSAETRRQWKRQAERGMDPGLFC